MGKSQDLLNNSTNWMSRNYDIMLIPWLLAACHNGGLLHHILAVNLSATRPGKSWRAPVKECSQQDVWYFCHNAHSFLVSSLSWWWSLESHTWFKLAKKPLVMNCNQQNVLCECHNSHSLHVGQWKRLMVFSTGTHILTFFAVRKLLGNSKSLCWCRNEIYPCTV